MKVKENIEDGRHFSELDLVKNVGSMGNTGTTTEVTREVEWKSYMTL